MIDFAKNYAKLQKDIDADLRSKEHESDDDIIFGDKEEDYESSEHEREVS